MIFFLNRHFLTQTQYGQKGQKKQKSEAKKVLLCSYGIFFFKLKNLNFLTVTFFLDFSHGLALILKINSIICKFDPNGLYVTACYKLHCKINMLTREYIYIMY